MGKEYLIIIVIEGYLESESIIEAPSLFLHAVLIVANVLAISVPPYSSFKLCCLLGV